MGAEPHRKPIRDPKNPLLQWPAADARTRIHIERAGSRFAWSFGPRGACFHTDTIGEAIEEALERIEHEPAVIIYGGRQ